MATRPAAATPASLDDATVESFKEALHGQLLRPGSAGFEDARHVWNALIDKRPALIVRCADPEDVRRSIGFAREQAMPLSIKGGGHGVACKAVADGGLMLDLSPLADIQVDPSRRTARVGGGATWGAFDRATQAHGLATTGGIVPSTGVGGL